jgi:hypothetical protein
LQARNVVTFKLQRETRHCVRGTSDRMRFQYR